MQADATNAASKRPATTERHFEKIADAITYMVESHQQQPELSDLARHVGMSPHHFQRIFSDWAGVSPKKFLKAVTLQSVKERLRASETVLDAAFDVGLSGPGRLHDLFVSIDAVTPGEFKNRGAGMTFRYGYHPSPFGDCLLVLSERGLTGLSFVTANRSDALAEQMMGWEQAEWIEAPMETEPVAVSAFRTGERLDLLLRGSPFRVKVWDALLRIPEGSVLSYGDLASRIGRPGAARAVASAVAKNLIGYVIPCHRVIRESGALSDYRWGSHRKRAILGAEALPQGDTRLESARVST